LVGKNWYKIYHPKWGPKMTFFDEKLTLKIDGKNGSKIVEQIG
jgi:hypothetical protein